jgi:phosphatidylglycerol---prolipoprotein diacylglyceryl transferase
VKRRDPEGVARLEQVTEPSYFIALAIGALIGAWFLGSLNSLRWSNPTLSHSVGGALAGGIVAVELWKWRAGVKGSTGASFVLPVAVGIMIGRLGCFFSGIADHTYGTATSLPWAVDLGDGVGRHPVQLYEAGAMALFVIWYLAFPRPFGLSLSKPSRSSWPLNPAEGGTSTGSAQTELGYNGVPAFYIFIATYAAQRFIWEFLKPYPPLMFGLNIFHILMLGLIAYAIIYARNARRP